MTNDENRQKLGEVLTTIESLAGWAKELVGDLVDEPAVPPAELPDDSGLPEIATIDFTTPSSPSWLQGVKGAGRLEIDLIDAIARLTYPAGWEGGSPPGYVSYESMPFDIRRVRVDTRVRLSPNFVGHPSTVNKFGFIWTGGDGTRPKGRAKIVLQLRGAGAGPIFPEVWLQRVPMEDSPAIRNLSQNVAVWEIERGEWFDWTVEVFQNDDDEANGEIRWWINGHLVGHHTGLQLTTSDEQKHFPIVSWRPVWGGTGSTIQQEQWMECDHIRIRGE